MRRVSAVAVTAALGALLLVGVAAGDSAPRATGGGTFGFGGEQRLEFQAHDYGPPADDRGRAHYENLALTLPSGGHFSYTADIICADIEPTVVRFGYIIPSTPETGALAGTNIIWVVKDGGSPGEGNDSAYFVQGFPATDCDIPFVPRPGSNVFTGNYTVHDG
jgi:hypothetical protein